MTLEEIYNLEPKERLIELKKRKTQAPDATSLMKDWDERNHDVMDAQIRKKRKFMKSEEIKDSNGNITKPAEYEWRDVNRIALPLEQDIVNIHTAFTVGMDPKTELISSGDDDANFLNVIKSIFRQNKIKFINKKAVRSWLSECEVAEYWYTVDDSSWWKKVINGVLKMVGASSLPTRKLKVAMWSPFMGDKLYPYFDEYGDLIVLSREYETTDVDGQNKVTMFMSIDKQNVTIYKSGEFQKQFKHNFDKLPVIYMYRPDAFCSKIKTIRERLETLLSNYADCIDYNFYPKLAARGVVEGIMNRGTAGEIIQLEDGAEISYLTWSQSPEMAKLEFETLTERAYSLTNTPRISFENLKGTGNAFSGVSFRYAFMGIHLAVSNHAETVEEYLQRRVNFLVHAVGKIYPKMAATSESIEIETEIVPYMIDNKADNVDIAVSAVAGGIASVKTGIILAGLSENVEDELKLIESDIKKQNDNKNTPKAM